MNQDIALAQTLEKRLPLHQLARVAGRIRREQQLRRLHQIDHLLQSHQIHRARYAVQGVRRQLKLLQQKIRQVIRAAGRDLQSYRFAVLAML